MFKRKAVALAVLFLMGMAVSAQQATPQPLTYWYCYTVKPGQDAAFMELVNQIGAPVRDKLMAEGVVLGWGVEVPLLRQPDGHTHYIWYAVMDMAGVEKVQRALAAQIAKVGAESAQASTDPRRRGQPAGPSLTQRMEAALDMSKTRDYLTRDIVFVEGKTPGAGLLPMVRYNFGKALPGKFTEWRAAWDKYNKPVLDKLVADGVILAYGIAVEEVRTDTRWGHFVWFAVKDASGFDKQRAAFLADRARRSAEERSAITAAFAGLTEPDAAQSLVTMSTVFKVRGQ